MTFEQVEMKNPIDSANGGSATSDAVAEFENQEAKRISARERQNAMTDRDRALLDLIQTDFPLEARPYQVLAEKLDWTEDEVIASMRKLRDLHVLRQMSAIFDSRRLGYRTSLVAMKVAPERVQEAAEIINQHPGVSHNYERNHPYNIWFTIAVPPTGDLQRDVDELHERAGAEKTWMLPTLKLFKIGVVLDMTGEADLLRKSEVKHSWSKIEIFDAPSPSDQELIRVMQQDLELVPRPFDAWAAQLGISVEQLFTDAHRLLESKMMRRFSAVMHHRDAGYISNAMAVWEVPKERIDEVGPQMASFAAVSHCYERPVYPDWPYSIFTMVHGRKKGDCMAIVDAIEKETGITDRALLFSTKEFKKVRVQYFDGTYEKYRASLETAV
jgi:DNA-binding Lrp family transcriptional regulator